MCIRLINPFHPADPQERLLVEQEFTEELWFHIEMRQLDNGQARMESGNATQYRLAIWWQHDEFGSRCYNPTA